MSLNKDTEILIVGLGLMGGSYAEALTQSGYTVGAVDKSPSTVEYALRHGLISSGRHDIDPDYIGRFDIIVFALYPTVFTKWLVDNQKYIKKGALLTDVTGVKCSVVYTVQNILRDDLEFIGAHPMAGREVSGVENAKAEMFKGANYIVTPTEKNTPEAIETCMALGHIIGCEKFSTLSPEEHDEMIGFLSQLTHCIAVALMISKEPGNLNYYTGDSFRDLTRIARLNDEMWSELFMLNQDELLDQMDIFINKFEMLRDYIARGDRENLRKMMRLSTERRARFEKR